MRILLDCLVFTVELILVLVPAKRTEESPYI